MVGKLLYTHIYATLGCNCHGPPTPVTVYWREVVFSISGIRILKPYSR